MKRILLLLSLFFFNSLHAQVEDISFTLAPTAEYVWWDDQTGLESNFLYGGKIGFGFGEYLELSGIYQTSNQLQTDFSSFGLTNFSTEIFEKQDVKLNRYGGELKVNFSKGRLSPYATLGTGIQSLEVNETNLEQIYAGFGLGLRLGISNRINLLIEAKAIGFSIDAANNLLTTANQVEYGVNTESYGVEETFNFGAIAALQFYLGGRKPGELSSLDRAYLNDYQGNFKGWSWVLEPSLAYVDFDAESFYRNTWMGGAYFGVDFTKFVGVRVYYFQAMQDESINLDFEDLNTYGLEFRAKLNDGSGVNPYLILGGGYLNVESDYEGVIEGVGAQSTGFANAGLGLDIPLGRNVLITGGARAMATSSRNIVDALGPDVLQTHVMYNAGIKIQVGKRANRPDASKETLQTNELSALEQNLNKKDREDYERLNRLIQKYNLELKDIDNQLENTYQKGATSEALYLLEQKREVSKELREVEKLRNMFKGSQFYNEGEYLKMTPQEFEDLIDRILEGIDKKFNENESKVYRENQESDIQQLAKKVIELQNKLNEQKNAENGTEAALKNETDSIEKVKADQETKMILDTTAKKQNELNSRLELLNKRIEELNQELQKQQQDLEKDKEETKELKSNVGKIQKATEATDKKLKELDKKIEKESQSIPDTTTKSDQKEEGNR